MLYPVVQASPPKSLHIFELYFYISFMNQLCLISKSSEVYPEVVDCRWCVTDIKNLKVKRTRNFRHVRIAVCIIPYIMYGGLYYLICGLVVVVWKGPCPPLYSLGDRFTWKF
jgi:hypothetical protein